MIIVDKNIDVSISLSSKYQDKNVFQNKRGGELVPKLSGRDCTMPAWIIHQKIWYFIKSTHHNCSSKHWKGQSGSYVCLSVHNIFWLRGENDLIRAWRALGSRRTQRGRAYQFFLGSPASLAVLIQKLNFWQFCCKNLNWPLVLIFQYQNYSPKGWKSHKKYDAELPKHL